jgi:hypothetical protein
MNCELPHLSLDRHVPSKLINLGSHQGGACWTSRTTALSGDIDHRVGNAPSARNLGRRALCMPSTIAILTASTLSIWQAQFGLSYAGLAIVRALYYGMTGGLQIPADHVLRGLSSRTALILSTVVAAGGFLFMALPLGFAGLCLGLVVAGVGSSIRHPRGSMLVTDTYGEALRPPTRAGISWVMPAQWLAASNMP